MAATKQDDKMEEFEYLPPPNTEFIPYADMQETLMDKLKRKTKDNPFVPIGLGFTTFALAYGLWQMKSGNAARSQTMMRLRIAGQGFTMFAVLGGILYTSAQKKKN